MIKSLSVFFPLLVVGVSSALIFILFISAIKYFSSASQPVGYVFIMIIDYRVLPHIGELRHIYIYTTESVISIRGNMYIFYHY